MALERQLARQDVRFVFAHHRSGYHREWEQGATNSGEGGSHRAMGTAGHTPRFGLWRVAYSVAALLACRVPGECGCRLNWDHRRSLVFLYRLFAGCCANGLECRVPAPGMPGALLPCGERDSLLWCPAVALVHRSLFGCNTVLCSLAR